MAKPQIDVKGEFLLQLIENRNYWLSKVTHGGLDNEQVTEYAQAYEKLIFAATKPIEKPKTS